MNFKLLTLLLWIPLFAFSQREDNIWFFGGSFENDSLTASTLIDFGSFPLEPEFVFEFPGLYLTNTNVSDSEGNLLFYSNGVHLYNANHEIVENGEELQSSDSYPLGYWMIQGGLIFPFPDHPGRYMFTLCDDIYYQYNGMNAHGCHPLTYSIIENNETGGIVTEKKTILSNDTLHYNQLQGIQHANGRDWWLVSAPHSAGSNRYHKFLLTPDGIALHDIQHIGEPYWKQWGQGAVSPNGEWIAYYNLSADGSPNYAFYVDLLRFDRCTGQLSDHIQMIYPQEGATGGIAFSPDSKLLYVSDRYEIFQFDMEASDIMGSRLQVATYDGFLDEWGAESAFGLMKLAPDGKIYVCSTTIGTIYMHRIEQPNVKGLDCEVAQHSFILPTRNNRSLPHHPTYRLGPLEGSACDTLDLTPVSEEEREVFRIFPNPAKSSFWVQFDQPLKKAAVLSIYDVNGKRCVESKVETGGGKTLIDASNLISGIYVVVMKENQEVHYTSRITIIK